MKTCTKLIMSRLKEKLNPFVGTASVARAFSANLDALTNKTMSAAFEQYFPINAPGLSPYCDFFSLTITLALSGN